MFPSSCMWTGLALDSIDPDDYEEDEDPDDDEDDDDEDDEDDDDDGGEKWYVSETRHIFCTASQPGA